MATTRLAVASAFSLRHICFAGVCVLGRDARFDAAVYAVAFFFALCVIRREEKNRWTPAREAPGDLRRHKAYLDRTVKRAVRRHTPMT